MQKIKSAQIVTLGKNAFMYVVTEDGGLYFCEHNPKTNDAKWTRIKTPSK